MLPPPPFFCSGEEENDSSGGRLSGDRVEPVVPTPARIVRTDGTRSTEEGVVVGAVGNVVGP